MLISGANRMSRISSCLEAAHHFLLPREAALAIVAHHVSVIGANWNRVCEQADLSPTDRALFWGRQFLNPFAFDDLNGDAASVKHLASDLRQAIN